MDDRYSPPNPEADGPYRPPKPEVRKLTPVHDSSTCSLPWPLQRRNLILFACCTSLQYLAAPVLYVGITQASLCDRLETTRRVANLPATMFFAMTAVPALIAWASPRVASLRRNLLLCYAISGLTLLLLALALALPVPNSLKIALVILQGGVSGAVMPAAIAMLWEVIGRGADESKRGWALSLAFGAGPILAVVGSFGQSFMLGGSWFGFEFSGIRYPTNFVTLFAIGGPVMFLAAALTRGFVVPPVPQEPTREPASQVLGLLCGVPAMFASVTILQFQTEESSKLVSIIGYGLGATAAVALISHFRPILSQRVLLLATIVTVLVYCGNTIPSNMNLYTQEVLGDRPERFAGMQNTLRFGFKVVAGAVLGWFLTKTSPRAGMLATSGLFLIAQIWAALATGTSYLIAFGIYGAGELIGVYSPNYMASASRTHDLRRNMAFATMLMVPAAPVGYLFGSIVDLAKKNAWSWRGMSSETLGFRLSFATCAMFILTGILVAIAFLPRHPGSNRDEDRH